jgi:hypothetical protein
VNSSRREDGAIELATEFCVMAEHLEREATRWHEFARHNRATACGSGPRSRERDCFLVVQTLWAEKIQSTTDAGSLNTSGRNQIEVAPISSALVLAPKGRALEADRPAQAVRVGSRRARVGHGYQLLRLTLEKADNSPVGSKRGQNIVENRTGGWSAPTTVNSSVRTREYLTTAEIERLMAAARKSSRYGHRDATMILIGYRHGLRASELCNLQWSQVELATGRLHVRRAKNGSPSVHPMQGPTRYARCGVCSANRGRLRTSS